MIGQARTDIRPLCDKHRYAMVPVVLSGRNIDLPLYGCRVPNCTRHYDIHEGYLDVIGERPLLEKAGKQPCPEHEAAMYLESRDPQTGEEVWRCPHIGCSRTQRMKE